VELWLPVFGDIKFVTSTIFDIGVYIVVVGLALDVLRSLGAEIDEHFEEPAEPSEDQDTDGGFAAPADAGAAGDTGTVGVDAVDAETSGRGKA
jgi:multicomponent Na+:H+ antiporter subunit A